MPLNDTPRLDRHGHIDKSACELPEYPKEFTSTQRVIAYWYALHHGYIDSIDLETTDDWWGILDAAHRQTQHRQEITQNVIGAPPLNPSPPGSSGAPSLTIVNDDGLF